MKFKITFEYIMENVESEEQAYDLLLEYLNNCARCDDATAFNFEQVKED